MVFFSHAAQSVSECTSETTKQMRTKKSSTDLRAILSLNSSLM